RGVGIPAPFGSLGPDGDDQAPLYGLLDPLAFDDARSAGRRPAADRRSRLPPARPRAPRPTGRIASGRSRAVGALRLPAADAGGRLTTLWSDRHQTGTQRGLSRFAPTVRQRVHSVGAALRRAAAAA